MKANALKTVCLAMVVLSSIFFVSSHPFWLPFDLPKDYPNSISWHWSTPIFRAGFVSHRRLSCLFVTRQNLHGMPEMTWHEIRDGHFCNFPVPPHGVVEEPHGFSVSLNARTIGWNCPYFLMGLVWLLAYLGAGGHTKTVHLFVVSGVCAQACASIVYRMALPIAVAMNVLTVAAVCLMILRGIRLSWACRHVSSTEG